MDSSPSFVRSLQNFIIKRWFLLHLGFIVFYALYTLYKVLFSNGANPLSQDQEVRPVFSGFFLGILLAGFLVISIPVFYTKLKNYQILVIFFLSYLMISLGYLGIKDKELQWFGSDVAWGNYDAAVEFRDHGILKGVQMWNERTNPYIENTGNNIAEPVKSFIGKYNLSWIAFNKWELSEFPGGYDPQNNRPHMHPPLAPIMLAGWLAIFPFGHWSAEIFMILLEFFSIYLVFNLAGSHFKNSRKEIVLLLALLTTPVMVIYHNPSGEQLSMLLFLLSVMMIYDPDKAKPRNYLISGILIGLTFYTKFNILFYIIFQVIFFILHRTKIKWKDLILYLSGIAIVVALFTLMGYYFWLTIVTGFVYSKTYALYNQVSTIQGLSKLLYFGATLILALILLISDSRNQPNKTILTPVILSLCILVIYLWDQGTLNRYLTFYLPVLGLFFMNMQYFSGLKKRDIIMIPATGFIFLSLNTYF